MSNLIPPEPGSIDDPPVRLATIRQRVASIDATEGGLAYAYRDDGAFLLGQLDAVKAERDAARDALAMAEEREREMVIARGIAATEIDELRLEIAAMRGREEGRISDRWTWKDPCWNICDEAGEVLAKVATTNLLAWADDKAYRGGGSGIEQATSVRDGMRRCEARLAGGAS